jgi:hypothetical protein
MRRSLNLGKILGIPIKLHSSWFLVALLLISRKGILLGLNWHTGPLGQSLPFSSSYRYFYTNWATRYSLCANACQ